MKEYRVKLELLHPGPLIPILSPLPRDQFIQYLDLSFQIFSEVFSSISHTPQHSLALTFFFSYTRLCSTCDHYIWLSHFLSTWYLHTPLISLLLVEQLIFSQRTVHPRVVLYAHSSHAQVIVCVCTCVSVRTLSRVQLFVFPWIVAMYPSESSVQRIFQARILGMHVHPWWIHVNVWQNQYSIVK